MIVATRSCIARGIEGVSLAAGTSDAEQLPIGIQGKAEGTLRAGAANHSVIGIIGVAELGQRDGLLAAYLVVSNRGYPIEKVQSVAGVNGGGKIPIGGACQRRVPTHRIVGEAHLRRFVIPRVQGHRLQPLVVPCVTDAATQIITCTLNR